MRHLERYISEQTQFLLSRNHNKKELSSQNNACLQKCMLLLFLFIIYMISLEFTKGVFKNRSFKKKNLKTKSDNYTQLRIKLNKKKSKENRLQYFFFFLQQIWQDSSVALWPCSTPQEKVLSSSESLPSFWLHSEVMIV